MTAKQAMDAQKSQAFIEAINRSMGMIEFSTDGLILSANPLFLELMGYSLDEIKGKHHRIFLTSKEASSAEYKNFWTSLAAGNVANGQFERVSQDGKTVWLEASYNPVLDSKGQVTQVVKVAADITKKVIADQQLAITARDLELAMAARKEADVIRQKLDLALQEASTPIMPIWEEILLLPLVGIVDSTRSNDVMRKSLEMIAESRAKMFILDISGVPTVDTAVANQLLKITKATRFMGCETIISGLSPEIAKTITELGIDVSEIQTTANLRDAFRMSLKQVGAKT